MSTGSGALTIGRPIHLKSLLAGFTALGVALGLVIGVAVTRQLLEERSVAVSGGLSPSAIYESSAAALREQGAVLPETRSAFENSTAAVREQGATMPQVRSAFENSTAAVREQGAVLPWYAAVEAAIEAGFTGRLGGVTDEFTPVRRGGHLTPKSGVVTSQGVGDPIMVNGQPCHQCA